MTDSHHKKHLATDKLCTYNL